MNSFDKIKIILVGDNEWIARIIRMAHVDDGILSPAAFSLRDKLPPENYMSVHRLNLSDLTFEMALKVYSRKLYGYARLSVEDTHSLKTENAYTRVAAYPNGHNRAHAGIHIVVNGRAAAGSQEAKSEDFLEIVSELALRAVLIPLQPSVV